ncbi:MULTISPECIES: BolA/IbaG family iron-sulfur metabolism protein [Candidatus Ichthyocystis]|uniref:Putative transcriptional regulator, BolA family n=1 Tax=Candidatus Ichthyocystis hellenicum TaxID=1561003 RepID=A0A0S4M8Y8_9BURK|nr:MULTISPECIES: BolA family protein [Ichthyocystis]CUT17908.1 putative transcriptional regulator, BolA family [Candidatus Ichthyocystis hellenicum]
MTQDESGSKLSEVVHKVENRLQVFFSPSSLSVKKRLHSRHNDYRDSDAVHLVISIESSAFNGLTSLQSHRLVYSLLDDMIPSEIHSVIIKTVSVSV